MSLQRLSAWQGCEYLDGTTTRTGKKYNCFIAQEDTVVEVLSGGKDGNLPSPQTNYMTEIGLTGKTLKQGALIVCPIGEVFDTIKLTSGSVIGYK